MPSATLRRNVAGPPPPLSATRRRVVISWAITFALLVTVALGAGFVFAFTGHHRAIEGPLSTAPSAVLTTRSTDLTEAQRRDALAAAPMATLAPAAANPHGLLPRSTVEPLMIPNPSAVRGLVRTGFPQTPAGAIAQLAAIDETALAGMNPAQVDQVYADWAVPGADPVELWSVDQFVQQTLTASGIPDGSSQLEASYAVTEAQVKGTVGTEFVVACVNGEFDASLLDNAVRVGAADCARMTWTGLRWQIAPGTQPTAPPNAWPGTAEAAQAGWRPVTHA